MSEDIFDVVDEDDRVTGQELRHRVHALGLRHRAVHILVRNAAGHVFLQRRSAFKDKHPNVWDSSCSGHVDTGEEYDFTAARELHEELGVEVSGATGLPRRLFKIEAREETGQEFVWVYEWRHEGPFVLPPEEIADGRFFLPGEIDAWVRAAPENFAPAFVFLWPRYREV